MTKREWDVETKVNHGAKHAAGASYRRERAGLHPIRPVPRDYVADRARTIARERGLLGLSDAGLPTLGVGSSKRASTAYRAGKGLSLLRLGGEP